MSDEVWKRYCDARHEFLDQLKVKRKRVRRMLEATVTVVEASHSVPGLFGADEPGQDSIHRPTRLDV